MFLLSVDEILGPLMLSITRTVMLRIQSVHVFSYLVIVSLSILLSLRVVELEVFLSSSCFFFSFKRIFISFRLELCFLPGQGLVYLLVDFVVVLPILLLLHPLESVHFVDIIQSSHPFLVPLHVFLIHCFCLLGLNFFKLLLFIHLFVPQLCFLLF